MPSAEYYRAEAKRCRELAARSMGGAVIATQWLTLAAEYETLAEALEGGSMWGPTPGQRMQQQPVQQQQHQQKKKDP